MKYCKSPKIYHRIEKKDSGLVTKEDLTCQTDKDFASTMPGFNTKNKTKPLENESFEDKYFKTRHEFLNENRKSLSPKSPIVIRDMKNYIPVEV